MANRSQQIDSMLTENLVDVHRIWQVIRRNKWKILALAALATILAKVVLSWVDPVYRATNTVLIENQEAKVVAIQGVSGMNPAAKDYYLTQIELPKSKTLTERLMQQLDLQQLPEFDPHQHHHEQWFDSIPGLNTLLANETDTTDATADTDASAALARVTAALTIEPVSNTQLVKINFDSHDPELAARAANTMANIYVDSTTESRLKMTRQASGWLTDRLQSLSEKLKASEAQLQDYREKEALVEMAGVKTLNGEELSELTQRYVAAQHTRSDAQNRYEQIRILGHSPALELLLEQPDILNQDLVKRLKSAQARADLKVAELSKRYGPRHPQMIAAKAEAEKTREELQRQVMRVARSIKNQYDMALESERAVKAQLAKAKQDAQDLNRKEFKLSELERQVDTNRQLYDMFLTRAKETSESDGLEPALARVVDPATAPRLPVFPNTRLILLLTLLASLGLGVMLTLMQDALDNSIKSPDELEDKLHIRLLGFLPKTKSQHRDLPLEAFHNGNDGNFAEAIRSLRTCVLLSQWTTPPQVILITSTLAGEGKSTVALNLAEALGQMERVLLIEADLRHSTLARALGSQFVGCGLVDLVSGDNDIRNCIQTLPERELDILAAGTPIPNPQELLSSRRFDLMLNCLKQHYDRIVIDSPPVHLVSDGLVLSRFADGVIYVVKANETATNLVNQGLARLQQVRAPIFGTVLNQVETRALAGYGNYYASYPPRTKRRTQHAFSTAR